MATDQSYETLVIVMASTISPIAEAARKPGLTRSRDRSRADTEAISGPPITQVARQITERATTNAGA
jgi:hypothetical protein